MSAETEAVTTLLVTTTVYVFAVAVESSGVTSIVTVVEPPLRVTSLGAIVPVDVRAAAVPFIFTAAFGSLVRGTTVTLDTVVGTLAV